MTIIGCERHRHENHATRYTTLGLYALPFLAQVNNSYTGTDDDGRERPSVATSVVNVLHFPPDVHIIRKKRVQPNPALLSGLNGLFR